MDHHWDETQWDTTRVGFVTGHDPSFFNRTSQAAAKFNANLHSKLFSNKIKIPKFRFMFTSPQVRHSTHTVSTKAYAIEVLSKDSEDVTSLKVAGQYDARVCTLYATP